MIFLTGGNGLVGSYLIRDLLDKGYKIRALKRESSDLTLIEDRKNEVEWVNGDMLDPDSYSHALEGIEAVFHCAASVSYDPKDKDLLLELNVKATKTLVDFCLEKGIKDLVQVSSVAAIGPGRSDILDESTKWEDSADNTYYAKSKYLSELEVWRGSEEGLNVLVVNPSLVLGPADWSKTSTQIFKQIYTSGKYYVDGLINYVDVRDVSAFTVDLFSKNVRGQRFILSSGSVEVKTFFHETATRLGKQFPKIRISYSMVKVARVFMSIQALFTGGRPKVTRETLKSIRRNRNFNGSKALKSTGLSYKTLKETLDWVCADILSRNNIHKR